MSDPSLDEAIAMARTIGRTADLREARRIASEMIRLIEGKQNATAMMALAMTSAILLCGGVPDPQGCELDADDEDVVADALPWLIRAWRDWIAELLEGAGTTTSVN
jgi:hypothetical protein